jgi:hypothetical protein
MRTSSFTLFSVGVLVLALLAWAGVWFLFTDVSGRLNERAQTLSSAAVQNVQQESAIEVTALTSDTSAQRAALDDEVGADVVGIANQIQSAGKSSGATTIIGSASAAGAPNAASGVSQLDFVVQSTGTFDQVWRAAQLFENLPLPSSVQELDFEQFPGASGKGDSWQLTADIEVLTSSAISS